MVRPPSQWKPSSNERLPEKYINITKPFDNKGLESRCYHEDRFHHWDLQV